MSEKWHVIFRGISICVLVSLFSESDYFLSRFRRNNELWRVFSCWWNLYIGDNSVCWWKNRYVGEGCRAWRIISNDTKISIIQWKCDTKPSFWNFCVDLCVGAKTIGINRKMRNFNPHLLRCKLWPRTDAKKSYVKKIAQK